MKEEVESEVWQTFDWTAEAESNRGPSAYQPTASQPGQTATLILPPLLKPPSRRTCLIIISKLFFTAVSIPSSDVQVCMCACMHACVCACLCACVSVVIVIIIWIELKDRPEVRRDSNSRETMLNISAFLL